MSDERKKQGRLFEVYRELNCIKDQLQAVMSAPQGQPPPSPPVITPGTRPNNALPGRNRQPDRPQHDCFMPPSHSHKLSDHLGSAKRPKPGDQGSINGPDSMEFLKKTIAREGQNHRKPQPQKNSAGETTRRAAERLRNELQYMPKIQFSSPMPRKLKEQEPVPPKKIGHNRHATMCDPCKVEPHFPFNGVDKIAFKRDKRSQPRPPVLKRPARGDEEMRGLNRVRSQKNWSINDRSSARQAASEEKKRWLLGNPGLRELEEELMKKDQVIEVLLAELGEIDRHLKDLDSALWKVLSYGQLQPSGKDTDLCERLLEVLAHMKVQDGELVRLNLECEHWRKLSLQQEENKPKLLGAPGQHKGSCEHRQGDREDSEASRVRREVAVLASKLQVSVAENRLKDEFIVKFLTAKEVPEGERACWVTQVLSEYLRSCDYPSNRLLQKLRQEELEIERLRAILQHRE